MSMKNYNELISLKSFVERFEYLKIGGGVGEETFGWERYLNQSFYKSREWLHLRQEAIIRDSGCDLAVRGMEIVGERIIIHHIDPITPRDILERSPKILDLNNIVCTRDSTHRGIHFGDISQCILVEPVVRRPGDTCPWRR